MEEIAVDRILDTKGMNCPMPVLKTKKVIDEIQHGQILEVIATDPGSRTDIPALLKRIGHELISEVEKDGVFFFYIRKNGA
ncbi:sulfurtransferase TusA [bacterium BMS3Bbin06]|nr:sulfurtransferase TusA [bacterium BMS3Abin08]GBE35625.1 sulfurtransferase TusA [bacterium BMS3Bbin06]HDH01351.1 sulfurtransferase TusA family protein [Nitrospirota bacterium]HDO36319.1 sulfurtransferase TusA family protein [Nitrospirota bacterium]HDY70346.1 sulfurtransferase TusA family protein [Nitrospirota bacterium]